tara:strand:- start:2323 stop:2805 length:483 start_codon:yes stop_codon:yes gene_type:complete
VIPRFGADSIRATDPFGGETYRLDREVDEHRYSLLAAAVSDTLHLGAQVRDGFVGEVKWRVGECQLEFSLGSGPRGSEIPIAVTGDLGMGSLGTGSLGTGGQLVGHLTSDEQTTTVRCEVPRTTLAKGDGTVGLEFAPQGQATSIRLPASGRLRGIYMMQ